MKNEKSCSYRYHCQHCDNEIIFDTAQPGGSREPLICQNCYRPALVEIPDRDEKHLYRLQDDSLKLRIDIIDVFHKYRDTMTVRQMFYRLLNNGYPKSEKFYSRVQRNMLYMREAGTLPFSFVADNTRACYRPDTYTGLRQMLEKTKIFYRRQLWHDAGVNVEIWLEKEALRSVFWRVTEKYDVPLFITRGFSSVSFVQSAAEEIKNRTNPTFVYLFTDHDPSGDEVARSIESRMKQFGATDNAVFKRAGLTPEQIYKYNLPERPTKKSTHSKGFKGKSVELDAMEPQDLRNTVEQCILRHIDPEQLAKIKVTEEAEKETLDIIINNLGYA